jgi:ATP-dependent HslUV protease ATP-binding subunit HslU
MIKQQQALLETEGVQIEFTDAAIREISRVAEEVSRILSPCLYEAADLS